MAQQTPYMVAHQPKHDIHKFRDIKPKLTKENWISWKRELMATARDRGLFEIITGKDEYPTNMNRTVTTVNGVEMVGSVPLSQLQDEWKDRNNVAYSQILLCISPEFQTAIDSTDQCVEAWKILVREFESSDPSKISIVRTKYENYHMTEGQSVSLYLTVMKEYRNQLAKMGEPVASSTHAATILRNVPESWRSIAQTIRMIATDPDDIEERLEAHEADLSTVEVSTQAATAFIAQGRSARRFNNPPFNRSSNLQQSPINNNRQGMQGNGPSPQPFFRCNNCGKVGHSAARCTAPGGGLLRQDAWRREALEKGCVEERVMGKVEVPVSSRVNRKEQTAVYQALSPVQLDLRMQQQGTSS
jgi:gag-polypeptide of LTR copia-type